MTAEQVDARPVLASALVTAVDHVGIAVPDLDAAIQWYHEHLGMILVHEEINEDQGIREAMLSLRGAAPDCAQIQLMAPLDENSTIAKFIDKRGPGIQQMAYRVSDLDAISDQLRSQGVRLVYDAPRRGTANSRINFIHPKDAGGVLVELVEPAAALGPSSGRAALRAVGPARRVPVPPVIRPGLSVVNPPDHHMCCAGADFVITARAPIVLDGPRGGDRTHLVVEPVGARLDAAMHRQRRQTGPLPTFRSAARHQNSRNSSLSMPRILS